MLKISIALEIVGVLYRRSSSSCSAERRGVVMARGSPASFPQDRRWSGPRPVSLPQRDRRGQPVGSAPGCSGGRLESWWNLCTQEGNRRLLRKTRPWKRSPSMPTPPVTPEKLAEIEDLERAIRQAIDEEIGELAADLATTDDAHLFGDNEFKIRALAHKIAAKALEQRLAQKKTDTREPA